MRYSVKHNLYHRSQMVDGKMLRCNREFDVDVSHVIRRDNFDLYAQLFREGPITLVAENGFGAIVGFA